ncbi:unnamed protein product [Rotaria sp. Silwood2]|nr:unnamed protein product [Rotaria sp. Silwood2]CAF2562563.1 unnamed protein product [Rotaria sp. Silwood2]CAF2962253.1 unnamed protein product [Rotaria sp. Silwood2]CAF3104737.1 unnamed protein product [Rotaria sp. Silwood2]CAF3887704.1 unnamed protein product [Rotaria sp. Silwood2]
MANILPVSITVTCSLLAYRSVRRIVRLQLPVFRRCLDRQMTAITLARVMILMVCGFPYICFSLYAANVNINEGNFMKLAIINLLSTILSSLLHVNFVISFYVFLILSSRFRRQAKTVLVTKSWRLIKSVFNRPLGNGNRNQVSPQTIVLNASGNELD